MKILIEGQYYPIDILRDIFEDPKFYQQKNNEGKIISVGYYHSFARKELVYMLPKVYMTDGEQTIFGINKEDLLLIGVPKNVKHRQDFNWIRQSTVYFYNSLIEYRRRINNALIVNSSVTFDLNTNLGDKEYSYLDLLLSFVNFYKKNKNQILYKHIEYISHQAKNPKWEKTIRKSLPILTSNKQPVYLNIRNKKKTINKEEELITYFFSILNNFNKEHQLFIKIDKSFPLIKGKSFERLQQNGLSKLRKIKYRYFNDTLKRMFNLCEIYFSKTDTSSIKKKREDFISVNNYNLVFEEMVDKLFSDKLSEKEVDGISLKKLRNHDDGKIVDHIYDDKSLIDTSNIFFIGDSKYYKPDHEAGKLSKYKQFTYAKNVIQFNINLFNKGDGIEKIRYRDELTEGYNITPNFFIYGYIQNKRNFDEPLVEKQGDVVSSYHFEERLFDRDTLFVHQYKINFLYVLKSFTAFDESKIIEFRKNVRKDFRDQFVEYINGSDFDFELFKWKNKEEDFSNFISINFKKITGRCFINNEGELLLAKHKEEDFEKSIMENFEKNGKLK